MDVTPADWVSKVAVFRECNSHLRNEDLEAIIVEAADDSAEVQKAERLANLKEAALSVGAEVAEAAMQRLDSAWRALTIEEVTPTLPKELSESATAFVNFAAEEFAKDGEPETWLLSNFANFSVLARRIQEVRENQNPK